MPAALRGERIYEIARVTSQAIILCEVCLDPTPARMPSLRFSSNLTSALRVQRALRPASYTLRRTVVSESSSGRSRHCDI
jgi:hypothetical protein